MRFSHVDLNADLGETENDYINLLALVTSVNVACGGHAGGGELLERTVAAAVKHEVQIGAHPSYPDRENFGRLSLRSSLEAANLSEQIGLVKIAVEAQGAALSHVKAHGALYNDAMIYEDVAEQLIQACLEVAGPVPLLGLPGSVLERICQKENLPFIKEGFVDRAYTNSGQLVSRKIAGAVLDTAAAVKQVKEILLSGAVTSIEGQIIKMPIQTLCVHGDTPHAYETLLAIRHFLEVESIAPRAFLQR